MRILKHVEGSHPTRRLLDEIDAHPGTRARWEWDALSFVHDLFRQNQRELLDMLAAIELNKDDLAITMVRNVGPPEPGRAHFRRLIRLLHNYVAGAVTLVDHSRNLLARYEGTPTHTTYVQTISELREQGVVPFVTKLRNYLLHYRLPQVGVRVQVDGDQETFTCYLDRDEALRWEAWPRRAREFLAAQPEHVRLRNVVLEYSGRVEVVQRWLYDQFPVLHGADIDAVNALIVQTPGWRRPDGSRGDGRPDFVPPSAAD